MRNKTISYAEILEAQQRRDDSHLAARKGHCPARILVALSIVSALLLAGTSLSAFRTQVQGESSTIVARVGTVSVEGAAPPSQSAQGKPSSFDFTVRGEASEATLSYTFRVKLDEDSEVSDARYRLFRIGEGGEETEVPEVDPEGSPGVFRDAETVLPHGGVAVEHSYRLKFIPNGSEKLNYLNDRAQLRFRIEITASQVN